MSKDVKQASCFLALPNYYIQLGWEKFWVMLDKDNGDVKKGSYFWFFRTRQQALDHRKIQNRMKNGARLTYPRKIEIR